MNGVWRTILDRCGVAPRSPVVDLRLGQTAVGPIAVRLDDRQRHPIDLRWVDEFVGNIRPHVMLRPEDRLIILVPNTPSKLNPSAIRVLDAMLNHGADVRTVLARIGDSPQKRLDLHFFFADLQDWLRGALGEGAGRMAVEYVPFTHEFCTYPVIAEIALTYQCNLSCSFCYAGCNRTGLPEGWDESSTMTDAEVLRVLDIIRFQGRCPSVSFTGGEPTMRPALPEFVAHANTIGMKTNLITNGTALTPRLVARLADAGLHSAQISLEGPTAEIHDRIARRVGAFDALIAGIGRLRDAGIRVHTNTTVSQENLAHLEAIVDRIADTGLERLTMNLIIPCGSAAGEGRDLHVPYSEIGPSILRVRARAEERGAEFIWYSPIPACMFNTVAHGLGNQGCAAADGLLHVNPAGEVLPCSSFEHDESLGNLLEQPFEEVWRSGDASFLRNKEMMPDRCEGCPSSEFCQGACTLYWREIGLSELGGSDADRPPEPASFTAQRARRRDRRAGCGRTDRG